ncbi:MULTISPECIES: hypothetical protein [Bacillaceae]|uniref:Uncharacterized protein n=1 Tax=Evansella alkalicola TaxID=745819 RepID=A0ABS6K088_9BACI|nr:MULTISPECIES: hypothetical protein [Bacillaceae]MBU9724264.1 hypothetical protein [Bacillus alkalicola]
MMFYGGMAGAAIMLPIAIYIFIKLKIKDVFQDLTGLRRDGSRVYTSYSGNTGKANTSSEIEAKQGAGVNSQPMSNQSPQAEMAATELIDDSQGDETALLSEYEDETMLLEADDETTLLGDDDETTLLSDEEEEQPYFKKGLDIVVVHSNTTI